MPYGIYQPYIVGLMKSNTSGHASCIKAIKNKFIRIYLYFFFRCRPSSIICLALTFCIVVLVYLHLTLPEEVSALNTNATKNKKYTSQLKHTETFKEAISKKLSELRKKIPGVARHKNKRPKQDGGMNEPGSEYVDVVQGDGGASLGTKILNLFKYYVGQTRKLFDPGMDKSEVEGEVEAFREWHSLRKS